MVCVNGRLFAGRCNSLSKQLSCGHLGTILLYNHHHYHSDIVVTVSNCKCFRTCGLGQTRGGSFRDGIECQEVTYHISKNHVLLHGELRAKPLPMFRKNCSSLPHLPELNVRWAQLLFPFRSLNLTLWEEEVEAIHTSTQPHQPSDDRYEYDVGWHGSLNVPIEHHPTITYMVYNGYYKVMSNIPKMGHLPTPGWCGYGKFWRACFSSFQATLATCSPAMFLWHFPASHRGVKLKVAISTSIDSSQLIPSPNIKHPQKTRA